MVKISTNIKNFIETITKKLFYTKTETDTKLNNKANTNHSHTSRDIEIASENDDGLLVDEYGVDTQTFVNCLVYDHEKRLEDIDVGANKTVVDSNLSSTSTNPVQNKIVNSALNGKANSSHNHSISNITNLQLTLENKSPIGHTHDDRYYTETEMDSKLNGKANSSHTHSISNITNLQSALDNKSATGHTHDDRYYTETEMDTKLDNKANSTHTHNISDVTGLSTSLDGKMSNDYSESTIESNFFAHKIGNIVIVTWWNPTLPTTQNSWVDWKTLPYKSCNTQHIWVDGGGIGREVRVRVPPNSNKLQVFISEGTGGIRAGMIVYPTK